MPERTMLEHFTHVRNVLFEAGFSRGDHVPILPPQDGLQASVVIRMEQRSSTAWKGNLALFKGDVRRTQDALESAGCCWVQTHQPLSLLSDGTWAAAWLVTAVDQPQEDEIEYRGE